MKVEFIASSLLFLSIYMSPISWHDFLAAPLSSMIYVKSHPPPPGKKWTVCNGISKALNMDTNYCIRHLIFCRAPNHLNYSGLLPKQSPSLKMQAVWSPNGGHGPRRSSRRVWKLEMRIATANCVIICYDSLFEESFRKNRNHVDFSLISHTDPHTIRGRPTPKDV